MNEIILTKDNFEEEVIKCDLPVLVDFFAVWCSPCSALAPVIEEIAEEYAGKVKVCKVNVDDQIELTRKFRVMSIPMLLFFKNGEITQKLIGYYSKDEIIPYINAAL